MTINLTPKQIKDLARLAWLGTCYLDAHYDNRTICKYERVLDNFIDTCGFRPGINGDIIKKTTPKK